MRTFRSGARAHGWRLECAIACLLPFQAAAQDALVIASAPSCAGCRIELVEWAEIGGQSDTIGLSGEDGTRIALSGDMIWVAPFRVPHRIVAYDRTGEIRATLGRQGSGPGEFRRIQRIGVQGQDTLHVFADGTRTRLLRDGTFLDSDRLEASANDVVLFTDGTAVVTGFNSAWGRAGTPLHVVRSGGGAGRSFGPAGESPERGGEFLTLGRGPSGTFWAAAQNRYEMTRWDTTGAADRRIRREAEWFPPGERRVNAWEGRPHPLLQGVHEDDEGRVWTLIAIANEDFKPVSPGDVDIHASLGEGHPMFDQYRTRIEVIDPEAGVLLAAREVPGRVFGFLEGGRVVGFAASEPWGFQILRIFDLELTTGGP